MLDAKRTDWLRKFTQEDLAAAGVRAGLASAGPLGAVIAEFITQFIPNQRIDRLHDFVEQMHERLAGLEDIFRERVNTSAAYATLLEEASLSAVRTASRARRRNLAMLMRTGIALSDDDLLGHQSLLRVLDMLNEAEVVILAGYGMQGTYNDPEYSAFREDHSSVFDVEDPGFNDPDTEKLRRWQMLQHYRHQLVTRGLLRDLDAAAVVRTVGALSRLEITTLGRILLEAIGLSEAEIRQSYTGRK